MTYKEAYEAARKLLDNSFTDYDPMDLRHLADSVSNSQYGAV